MCVPVVLIGADMDPHCWIHNSLWRHVCQDLEGARHLQKCKDEEEGIANVKKISRVQKKFPFTDTFDC